METRDEAIEEEGRILEADEVERRRRAEAVRENAIHHLTGESGLVYTIRRVDPDLVIGLMGGVPDYKKMLESPDLASEDRDALEAAEEEITKDRRRLVDNLLCEALVSPRCIPRGHEEADAIHPDQIPWRDLRPLTEKIIYLGVGGRDGAKLLDPTEGTPGSASGSTTSGGPTERDPVP